MKPQTIRTELGEELVVITRRDYLALRARAGDEEAEDEMTVLLAGEARADPEAGRDTALPAWFVEAGAQGDGSALRGLRRYRRLSQQALADAAEITQGYYSEIEQGRKLPTSEVLDRLSAALELEAAWLRGVFRMPPAAS